MRFTIPGLVSAAVLAFLQCAVLSAQQTISVHWDQTLRISRSTPTLQVVVNPMLERGSPIHDRAFSALKGLGAEYVRYVPWFPYPKMAVAELEPPASNRTFWDFTDIDPITKDFLAATAGHSTVMNFSTIPAWMFRTGQPVPYPADPSQVDWNYTQGTELRDPTGKELGNYYARLVSWYTRGGLRDELGHWHSSGYHYRFPYWEVLNEVDSEHSTTPEQYTRRYDAIVSAIHRVSPETKFIGMALADPGGYPGYFEYFLNPRNHQPGIPLDFISFHFYATPAPDEGPDTWQHTFFDQANGFLSTTRYILAIRDRLSPRTKIDTDELGVILPFDPAGPPPGQMIPHIYWNAAGALYAYLFVELSKMGVDVIGESQLVGYPSQYPSVSMIDYTNGKSNARYWVLKLLVDNFHSGDRLVATSVHGSDAGRVLAQGFVTARDRRLLLVNKANSAFQLTLPADVAHADFATVDAATGDDPPRTGTLSGPSFTVEPFAVTVLTEK
ncbi:MAG TPA: hypothetical protein VME18_03550 [Acidobacteriaceae bacterium]|nr:hypothetical protein [Acidobacteriaceae bacterium]